MIPKRTEQNRRASLKRQSILRANGLCVSCRKPSESFAYCIKCRIRREQLDKIRRDNEKEKSKSNHLAY